MQKKSLSGLRRKFLRKAEEKMKRREEYFKTYIKRLIDSFPKISIVLIGSRAKGEPLPYSDYDVVIILEEINNKFEFIKEARKYKPKGFNLDLIVLEKDELNDPLVLQMLKHGILLHDSLGIAKYLK
ncbi:MAG: nucleotidyltransferase domain-containing protein [Thermoprotei archaeon]|nr:MAG: nucleotidyltransferase domain-containing protein [Thermoprotei archaeon]